MLNLRIITAPTKEPISLQQAKVHLRQAVDSPYDSPIDSPAVVGPEDSEILQAIRTAREHAEQFTGRCFTDAEYEMRFDSFSTGWAHGHTSITSNYWVAGLPCAVRGIQLPLAPVREVLAVTYIDEDGDEQPFADYEFDDNLDSPQIYPAFGVSWPANRAQRNAVRVQFKGGYQEPNPVPEAAIRAMLLMIGDWNENRENEVVEGGIASVELTLGARTLLWPLRLNLGF